MPPAAAQSGSVIDTKALDLWPHGEAIYSWPGRRGDAVVAQEQKFRGHEIGLPSLPGPAGCQASHTGKCLVLGPGQTIPGTAEREPVASSARGVSHAFSPVLCAIVLRFVIPGCSPCADLTCMCGAEPWKANSMALYRADVVCCNCKRLNPQLRSNGIFQSTALGVHASGFG